MGPDHSRFFRFNFAMLTVFVIVGLTAATWTVPARAQTDGGVSEVETVLRNIKQYWDQWDELHPINLPPTTPQEIAIETAKAGAKLALETALLHMNIDTIKACRRSNWDSSIKIARSILTTVNQHKARIEYEITMLGQKRKQLEAEIKTYRADKTGSNDHLVLQRAQGIAKIDTEIKRQQSLINEINERVQSYTKAVDFMESDNEACDKLLRLATQDDSPEYPAEKTVKNLAEVTAQNAATADIIAEGESKACAEQLKSYIGREINDSDWDKILQGEGKCESKDGTAYHMWIRRDFKHDCQNWALTRVVYLNSYPAWIKLTIKARKEACEKSGGKSEWECSDMYFKVLPRDQTIEPVCPE